MVIHSSRCATAAGRQAIARWLQRHGIEVDEICEHKPPAMVIIDDRALRFSGDWSQTLAELNQLRK